MLALELIIIEVKITRHSQLLNLPVPILQYIMNSGYSWIRLDLRPPPSRLHPQLTIVSPPLSPTSETDVKRKQRQCHSHLYSPCNKPWWPNVTSRRIYLFCSDIRDYTTPHMVTTHDPLSPDMRYHLKIRCAWLVECFGARTTFTRGYAWQILFKK